MLQPRIMLFHVTNTIALAECAVLGGLLAVWADRVAGAWLLILFLAGVSLWIAGNELPTWLGPGAAPAGLLLLCTAPFSSAIFFIFAASFGRFRLPRWSVVSLCGVAAALGLAAALLGPGEFRHEPGLGYVAFPNRVGWVASLSWLGLAAAGYATLVRAWWLQNTRERQQIIAIGAASLLGAFCMSGYGIVVLGLPMPPWPLALLPAYPVALVYAILRYRLFVANDWAQRALAWALLTVLYVAAIALVAMLPLGQGTAARYVTGGLVALACLGLAGPFRTLAQRLVYPGGVAGADDLRHWRANLRGAETQEELAAQAEALLSRRLGMGLKILFQDTPDRTAPALLCQESAQGFHTSLAGWEQAPPGPRRLAELFGTVLADEAERLARVAVLAGRERERQTQARLAELGALAATVAHDVRNPLNIISMAAASVEPEMKIEISAQVARISRLTTDLLDYAKPWAVTAQETDIFLMLRSLSRRYSAVELGPRLAGSIMLSVDPHRLEQALANLLDNATAAAMRVLIDVERDEDGTRIIIADDGPGIPADIAARLFEPFVSRSANGTGLGLAIVARVMAAHGGTVYLAERPGWSTCFVLAFHP